MPRKPSGKQPRPLQPLRQFMRDNDLSEEGVAALLSERLEADVPVERVRSYLHSGRLTKQWGEALGIVEPTIREGDDVTPQPSPSSPRAKVDPPAGLPDIDFAQARVAIVQLHSIAAAMITRAMKETERGIRPTVAEIMTTPGQAGGKAPCELLADDWIALARVDERARKIVGALSAGGPAGQLVFDYALIVIAVLSRARPDGTVEVPRAREAAQFVPAPAPDGGGNIFGPGADRPVGDARTAPAE